MQYFNRIIKTPTWIVAGIVLVAFVGIIALLSGAGHRDNGSSESQAIRQSAPLPVETMARRETAKKDNSPDKLPVREPTGATKETSDTPEPNVRHSITLWNSAGRQFESNLLEAMGGRIASRRRPDGKPEYLLSFGGSRGSRLSIDSDANKVLVEGRESALRGAMQLVHALDKPAGAEGVGIRCVSTPRSRGEEIKRLIEAVRMDRKSRAKGSYKGTGDENPEPMAVAFQAGTNGDAKAKKPKADVPKTNGKKPKNGEQKPPAPDSESTRLKAPVQVQALEGMDALIIRGHPDDVKRVSELIRQIEDYSKTVTPATEIILLKHVDATMLGTLLKQLYNDVFSAREGTMSITPLAAPNALFLIGRPESVEKLKGLVEQLDKPLSPTARFKVFRLKNVAATEAQENITSFFAQEIPSETAMAPRVHVVADFRSNSLIVRASPNDMAEVAAIIERIDSGDSEAFNEVRVFKLKNASAEVLAPILQDAITGQMYGQRSTRGPGAMAGGMLQGRNKGYEEKSTRLKLVTIDAKGQKILNSGILTDAQVTADPRTNGLIVTASVDSMPLIAALIKELDNPPSVEAQVKVFTLVNGDATNMTTMLQSIFGAAVAGDEIAVKTGIVADETSLVGLNFAVDIRTNSIIVTGSAGALTVVEAVLMRLDESDSRERKTIVYRIKNISAEAITTAVNQYLTSKREVETSTAGVLSAFEQIEREVIVVPEPASNCVIISATPRYFDDIAKLIEDLDRQQAMIMIQVVIAEISLDNFDEFGIEMGLQDSLLFDRRLATGGLAVPGSLFSNTQDNNVGGRGLTSLGTGQINADLQYGGLVLNASSESVSALIRALSVCRRLKVLSRPQIMTMDNEKAQILVGEDVPYIADSSFTSYGQSNNVEYREVGLILTVTPRVSAEGYVVMEIMATNSKVGPIDEGIPVSVADGQVIKSPRIEMISAQTVVNSMSGQTVVLGGLIVEDDQVIERSVPGLSSIPVLGCLFKYESQVHDRKELLIIMTPRIVQNTDEAGRIAQIEASRLHWCRNDVQRLHGGYGGDRFFTQPCIGGGPQVIYPDETPTLEMMPETMSQSRDVTDGAEIISTPQSETPIPGDVGQELTPQSVPGSIPANANPVMPRLRLPSEPAPVAPKPAQPKTETPILPGPGPTKAPGP
ncbi:MAG: hypothetical protein JXM70_06845, partial [Pirellulales bacterium]|nr:hypothetical protein [Pirellulales bacterium]